MRKKYGMLFQSGALFDSLTVGENIALPLREHTKLDESIVQIIINRLRRLIHHLTAAPQESDNDD